MNRKTNSRVEWMGAVPTDWNVPRVKNIFYRYKSTTNKKDSNILSLARSGIKIRDITTGEGQIASDYSNYNPVIPKDIILNPMDLVSGDNCNISEVYGIISQAYINLKSDKEINPYYYNYYFKLQYWLGAFFAHGKGVSFENRWTLNNNTLMNYPVLKPNFKTQNKITDKLDKLVKQIEDLKIETYISINELKKYKQSIITEAVTKGLNPNVEMKDSGIEWIGKIPKKWNVQKLKYLLIDQLLYGANEKGESFNKTLPRYIRITDILDNNKLDIVNKQSLSFEKAKNYLLKKGDLLFARSGASVGKTFLVDKDNEGDAFAGYLIKASFKKYITSKYVYYYTKSSCFNEWKTFITIQSTIQNISAEKYRNLAIPISSIEEQEEIVEYLDEKTSLIDKLIEDKTKLIEELENYKKSVIYEYVTGKKEV